MNGRNVSGKYYRTLVVSVLGCAYLAVAPLSAIAQGAGGKGVSVTVNPTTGYTVINSQTIGTPRGTTVGPSGGVPSVTTRPGGGLSQSLPAGIEITGIRENAQTLRGPLGATINATAGALRNGAVRCLTSFRCTTALGLGSMGLQSLLDNMNWDLDPTGSPASLPGITDFGGSSQVHSGIEYSSNEGPRFATLSEAISYSMRDCPGSWFCPLSIQHVNNPQSNTFGEWWFRAPSGQIVRYVYGVGSCQYNSDMYGCWDGPRPQPTPVPSSDIADAVDQHYSPDPSDWNWLTGGMDFSDPGVTIDITDLPVLDGSNEPNFIQNADGTSRGTFNIYTPTARYNGTSKPEIEVRDEQTEINYDEQGNPTGSSTSTGTMTPNPGGSASSPDIVIPTDCDFMPTVCRFIDWFTEPDTQPDPDQEIRDLVQVYEDGGREVTVGPDSGSCPAPRIIELSLVPSVEFSFQPFCDLATAVRFWLLAIASFGAAYMTVRSI